VWSGLQAHLTNNLCESNSIPDEKTDQFLNFISFVTSVLFMWTMASLAAGSHG